MDFKWFIFLLLFVFGALCYFRDDLRGVGSVRQESASDLNQLEEKSAP